MCANPGQTTVAQQQIQIHKRKVQDSINRALAQIKKKSEDNSLASTTTQIKVALDSLAI